MPKLLHLWQWVPQTTLQLSLPSWVLNTLPYKVYISTSMSNGPSILHCLPFSHSFLGVTSQLTSRFLCVWNHVPKDDNSHLRLHLAPHSSCPIIHSAACFFFWKITITAVSSIYSHCHQSTVLVYHRILPLLCFHSLYPALCRRIIS